MGRACALEFARLGAGVTLLARDEAALGRVCAELGDRFGAANGRGGAAPRHDFIRADFAEPAAVKEAIDAHVAATGPYAILLNNTGGPPPGTILNSPTEAFQSAFAAHVLCNQILTQALVPGMKSLGYGRIINIISTSVRQPIVGLGVSNTIRGAVASWAKTLSTELAPFGITVNNLLPGYTDTERLRSLIRSRAQAAGVKEEEIELRMRAEVPMGRFAEPHELAAAAGFLASPAASYITGVSLPIDGGRITSL